MRILVLSRYGDRAASTRQRFKIYAPFLARHGFTLEFSPLRSNDQVARIGTNQNKEWFAGLRAYVHRVRRLLQSRDYDLIWVAYELFPYLPGPFERLIRLAGIPYVVDYDDAVFHLYDQHSSPVLRLLLRRKLEPLLRSASASTCGNEYLKQYVERFCANTWLIPTVVDTDRFVPRPPACRASGEALTIGWIGSPTNWVNVEPLLPTILPLLRRFGATLRVVGAGPRAEGLDEVDAHPWAEDRELADLQAMDVGIMPLLDERFQRGKCGYKLIQYMACGVPVIASPVGVNRRIVEEGGAGFLASEPQEWSLALERLLLNPSQRLEFGRCGRKAAVERYSLAAQAPRVLAALRSATEAADAGDERRWALR